MNLTERDNKAELALIATIHGKTQQEQRDFCLTLEVPWDEYQRLLRKWSRVIVRWNREKGGELKSEVKRNNRLV